MGQCEVSVLMSALLSLAQPSSEKVDSAELLSDVSSMKNFGGVVLVNDKNVFSRLSL